MRGLRQAIAFLTRLPMRRAGGADRSAAWFPLVGALIGLVVGGAYAALYTWVPSLFAAVVALTLGVWSTGAIHEDGLADSLDALGSGAVGEEAMSIMRDSRLGAHGTIAVMVSVLWRVVAIGSLAPADAIAGLVMAHSLARAGAVSLMAITPTARSEGLGHSFASATTSSGVGIAVVSGLVFSVLATGWWAVPAVTLIVLTVAVLRRLFTRRIGGVTGDLLGACEQISEMMALAVVVFAGWQGWEPWWAG